MPKIGAFISDLQSCSCGGNVFNPWSHWIEELDIGSEAPKIRSAQLEHYLRLRSNTVKWIFIAEALGYQGGRFTGIAMTSERILLGHQEEIPPSHVLQSFIPKRTSNPFSSFIKKQQKQSGFTEPTATVVWKELQNCGIDPFQTLFWNVFPFHPFDKSKGSLSNRTPNPVELRLGVTYVKKLIALYPTAKVIAIGKHSNHLLNQYGIENTPVPHPANGGINAFRKAMRDFFGRPKMKNTKSNFIDDLNGESVLANFLDKFLYEKLEIQAFSRNTSDKSNYLHKQYRGIDITFTFNGSDFIVDEKATLYYPDGIPTFAFELRYKKENIWNLGWLYDEKKETEYYLLAWPKREHIKLSEMKLEHIRTVEVMLICRKDLHDYMYKNFGLNKGLIDGAVEEIIKANQFGKLDTIHPSSNHYYYYTENLHETPINLVIQKITLKKLAIFHFVIYRNKPYAQHMDYNIWLKPKFRSYYMLRRR
jgi:hypothetical protein